MLHEYKTKTNVGIGVGFLLQIGATEIAVMFVKPGSAGNLDVLLITLIIRIIGAAVFIWGCWNYMIGKGYHGAFGLIGLLSLIGLIVLVCFPDKYKDGRAPIAPRGFDPLMRNPPPPRR